MVLKGVEVEEAATSSLCYTNPCKLHRQCDCEESVCLASIDAEVHSFAGGMGACWSGGGDGNIVRRAPISRGDAQGSSIIDTEVLYHLHKSLVHLAISAATLAFQLVRLEMLRLNHEAVHDSKITHSGSSTIVSIAVSAKSTSCLVFSFR